MKINLEEIISALRNCPQADIDFSEATPEEFEIEYQAMLRLGYIK